MCDVRESYEVGTGKQTVQKLMRNNECQSKHSLQSARCNSKQDDFLRIFREHCFIERMIICHFSLSTYLQVSLEAINGLDTFVLLYLCT